MVLNLKKSTKRIKNFMLCSIGSTLFSYILAKKKKIIIIIIIIKKEEIFCFLILLSSSG